MRPQALFLLCRADVLLGARRLQHFSSLMQFVFVAGPGTLLLAFTGWRLINPVTILIHFSFSSLTHSAIVAVKARPTESQPGSEQIKNRYIKLVPIPSPAPKVTPLFIALLLLPFSTLSIK